MTRRSNIKTPIIPQSRVRTIALGLLAGKSLKAIAKEAYCSLGALDCAIKAIPHLRMLAMTKDDDLQYQQRYEKAMRIGIEPHGHKSQWAGVRI